MDTAPITNQPVGAGRLPRSIRNLERRVLRLIPRSTPGMLTQQTTTGILMRPINLLAGNKTGGNTSTPKYH